MKKVVIASCLVALCTASPLEHPLQRAARKLVREGKTAQAPTTDPCADFSTEQKGKCSYGKSMKDMLSGVLMVCVFDPMQPECVGKTEDIDCMKIVMQQCIPPPDNVQCGANDVGGFVEMMASPCDKIADETQKAECSREMYGAIGDDCLACFAGNSAREQKGDAQLNCWTIYADRKECSWEGAAKVMGGLQCGDEAVCKEFRNSMTENDHVCLGCILDKLMGPKGANGEPLNSGVACISEAAMRTKPCKEHQMPVAREWGNCQDAASDAKDECEKPISDQDPDKDAKREQCDATEKVANAQCQERFVAADSGYEKADKLAEVCMACFMLSPGRADLCAPPDQRCTAEDVPKGQAGYNCDSDAAPAECRAATAKTLSWQCTLCQMETSEKVKATCGEPPVQNTDGNEEPDYFKCIPQLNLCDLQAANGVVSYKPTSRAPTAPPMSGNPPTAPPRKKYRKLRALLKLAKKKVKQTMKEFCNDQAEPRRCKKIGKELANKVFKALKANLGALVCTSVMVTHMCKLVGAASAITDAQLMDPAVCALVEELSDAGRAASFLQADVDGTLTAVYEMNADEAVSPSELTGVVDQAQIDGGLSVTDPVSGEDFVTGGDGTTGSTTDLGPSSTPAPPKKEDDDGSDVGMIIGIILGLLAALGLVAGTAIFLSRKKAVQFNAASAVDGAPAPMYQKAGTTDQGQI